MLGIVVHPANVQDRDGAEALLRQTRRSFPFIEVIFADGGYQGPIMAAVTAKTGKWRLEIVKRNDVPRFEVLPKRWIVERTWPGSATAADWPATSSAMSEPWSPSSILPSSGSCSAASQQPTQPRFKLSGTALSASIKRGEMTAIGAGIGERPQSTEAVMGGRLPDGLGLPEWWCLSPLRGRRACACSDQAAAGAPPGCAELSAARGPRRRPSRVPSNGSSLPAAPALVRTSTFATVVIGTGAAPAGRVLSCRSPSTLSSASVAANAKPPGGLSV
jgi:transposase